jgi:hypothetical protein
MSRVCGNSVKKENFIFFQKNFSGGGEGAKNFLLPHTPKEFFAPEPIFPILFLSRRSAAGQFSGVFYKMSSNLVV